MTNSSKNTYLLAWNPKNFEWADIDSRIEELKQTGFTESWWSTGSVKNIPVGSRFFVIRLGLDPRGIVGAGHTTGEVVESEHWHPDRRAAGDRMNRVAIRFDALAKLPLIRRSELEGEGLKGYKWDTQMSGVRIPPEYADRLEALWSERVAAVKRGDVLPTVAPADVERFRAALEAAETDSDYVERHQLRDKRRKEVHGQLATLIREFVESKIDLPAFKTQFHDRAVNEFEVFGLKGFSGAMFLNQIVKNIPAEEGAERVVRQVVPAPATKDEARERIDELAGFLLDTLNTGAAPSNSLKPANATFFLSACWHALEPDRWPTMYQSARKALQSAGLLSKQLKGGESYVAFSEVFSELAKALNVSFWTLEHLCDRLTTEAESEGDVINEPEEEPTRPRVWLVSPGQKAQMFGAFVEDGIIGIGWKEMGDLSKYPDLESVRDALKAHRGGDVSPIQDAHACFEFVRRMEVGDLIFAKKGRREIVGYGVVTGEYRYEPKRGDYPNVRAVEWRKTGSWIPREKALVLKTLTDIGKYPRLVADLKAAVGIEPGGSGDEMPPVTVVPVYTKEQAEQDLFIEPATIQQAVELLRFKQNLVLQGPPGVGKTFCARLLAYLLMEEQARDRVTLVQFHQSYAYEDFVQGYRPDGSGQFRLTDGVFLRVCDAALQDPDQDYVLIIDEINRGNLSKIFGELMMLIEADKRDKKWEVDLTYSPSGDEKFHVPKNLYLIGTMNTADRSLAMVDYALRRRFVFLDLEPGFGTKGFRERLSALGVSTAFMEQLVARIGALNGAIRSDKSLEAGFCVGHSYFCQKPQDLDERVWFDRIVRTEIAPLLREYWFDDREKADAEVARLLDW